MKTFDDSTESTIKLTTRLLFLMVALSLMACDPGLPEGSSSDLSISGAAAPLSQAEFNSLPAAAQYQVANKLYGTLFRGISADEFFDLNAGMNNLKPKSNSFLADTKQALKTDLSINELLAVNSVVEGFDSEGNANEDDAKYSFDDDTRPDQDEKARQIPLARIKEYPISRDLYVQWMAYFLSNTIMYSPAVEMETTDNVDAQNMLSQSTSRSCLCG